jgi:hypothetical protein
MRHESIQELETTLRLIRQQADGFTYRERAYRTDPQQVEQYGKKVAEAQALTQLLYSEAYARKRSAANASLQVPESTPAYVHEQNIFAEQLSEQNTTRERQDAGWTVTYVYPQRQLSVHKSGINAIVQPGDYILQDGAAQAMANASVTRTFRKESRTLQPAFYYVYSNQGFDHTPAVLRIYWNIEAQGAPLLVRSVTGQLNAYRVPFMFKCLNHPVLYNRRDAAVLYIQKRYMHMLEKLLPAIIRDVTPYLQADVPLFSYTLAPGVGFAESPANGDSFGLTRMRIVSAGLISALEKQYTKPEQQLPEILDAFTRNGISHETPFLNEGSLMTLKPITI